MKRMRRLDVVMADEPFRSSTLAFTGLDFPDLAATVEGGPGSDDLRGTTGDDILIGRGDRDILFGDEGNDVFKYEAVTDSTATSPDLILDLTAGDRIDLTALQVTSYRITMEGGIRMLRATTASGELVVHSQNAIAMDNVLLGNALTLTGTAGADQLLGANGNDLFRLEQGGNDSASGGAGSDQFYYGAAFTSADANDGGAGTDVVILQGNYAVTMGAASLVNVEFLSLQSGSSTRYGEAGTNSYDYDVTFVDANVAAAQRFTVNASQLLEDESFIFDGSAEVNGQFLVYGGYGNDDLVGGSGNDIFHFEGTRWGGGDVVQGGLGADALIIRGSGGLMTIAFGETQLTSIESITVSDRFGLGAAGRPSYDLTLANGNVTPGGTLILNGSTLLDPTQVFHVDGSAVQDGRLRMFGGAGGDEMTGGAGDDFFYAAGGADQLTGGAGSDTFQLRNLSDSTLADPDTILDFASGSDRIDLGFLDADMNTAGNQAFSFIGSGAFSGAAGELRAFTTGPGQQRVEGDVNGDGIADFALDVVISTPDPLVGSDFIL